MSDAASFADFLRRIRAGDTAAAEELVRRYETTIRVSVRTRLTSDILRRRFDSMDVCQSVLATFLARMRAGRFDIDTPEKLAALLVGIARNKVLHQARKARRAATPPVDLEQVEVADHEPTPSRAAAAREQLQRLRQKLNEEERRLMELRGEGLSWAEIAERLGGTADGRRKQWARALARFAGDAEDDDD
jgi:RNA polymerase sigma-70 factor (ECF subfamily)